MPYAKQYMCPKCPWTTLSTDQENLLSHLIAHGEKEHPGVKWSEIKLPQTHMKDFYLRKEYTCPECGQVISTSAEDENLIRHLMIHNQAHPNMKLSEEDINKRIKEVWAEWSSEEK
jgi:predicted small metal-binding protein